MRLPVQRYEPVHYPGAELPGFAATQKNRFKRAPAIA